VPRVRAARRDRDRVRHQDDQDRPAAAGGRQYGLSNGPRLILLGSVCMLTAEQNDELTQVAAGTPMGELLRRYWYPVAFTRALEEFPVRPARLLGEDFAVFKTPRGRYGLLPEACPHRRASLA